jgi:nucleoside-diphosphate-sugar epimerase
VTRDYLYIDDAVDALSRVGLHLGQANYNVGTGISYSLNEVARRVAALTIKRQPSRAFDVLISILEAPRAFDREPRITLEQGVTRTLYYMQATDPIR